MSPDEATNVLTAQHDEIESSIRDIESARHRLSKAEPCGVKPSPDWSRALGDLVFGMSRGMVALFRVRKAEIEASLAAVAAMNKTRRGILETLLGHAVRVAVLLMALGFFTLAVRAKSILELVKALLG